MYKIRGADGKDYGPVSADQVRQWISERRANAQTLVLAEGATDWKPLSEFPEFAANLTSAPPSPGPAFPAYPPSNYRAPGAPNTNPLAVTSLVLGILSLPCCGAVGIVFALLALVFAGIAISQINRSSPPQAGKGLAVSGIVLGTFGIILGILITVLALTGAMQDFIKGFLEGIQNS